jgi:tetratricopeptide (TPR) repeat protein
MVLGIVGAIEPKVKSAEIQRSRKKPTASLTAYDYYLQALPYRGAISAKDNETALELLEKSIGLDPNFAPALAVASMCYTTRRDQGWGTLSPKDIERTLHLARSAVAADFDDAVALCFSAHTLASIGNDLDTATSLIDRSLHISPSYAEAWARSAMIRIYAGDLARAESHAENAIKLGPLDDRLFMPLCALGYCYLFSGRHLQAIEVTQRALLGRAKPPMAYIIQIAAAHGMGNATIMSKATAALAAAAPSFDFQAWLSRSCFVLKDQRRILEGALRSAASSE